MLQSFLLVALGGSVGCMMRYAAGLLIPTKAVTEIPWPTLAVNAAGSLLIGVLAGLAVRNAWMQGPGWRLLATGLCGGFTTFSALSLECVRMLDAGAYVPVALYLSVSIAAGLTLCGLGFWMAR